MKGISKADRLLSNNAVPLSQSGFKSALHRYTYHDDPVLRGDFGGMGRLQFDEAYPAARLFHHRRNRLILDLAQPDPRGVEQSVSLVQISSATSPMRDD